jgi:hypothetical protein
VPGTEIDLRAAVNAISDVIEGQRSSQRTAAREGPAAATQHHAAHPAAHLYLDRAARERMTMDVYAQLEQRVRREHGDSFDRLVRQAGESQADEIHGEQLFAQAA